ncbi:MAG: response regulator [Actinomycetota bacterium]|nr:response regulator [Actinomycetota bacterium]
MSSPNEILEKTLKVVVVDDHAAIRRSLRQLIELKGPYVVVGEGSNGAEAIERVEELAPDLVLMDMNMPVMTGAEATKVIKERHPHIKVLALTAFADMTHVSAMVKAGASGYLLKGGSAQELLDSLEAVAGGQGALDKEVTRGVMEDMAELYKKEQQRAAALEELDRMKSEFVSVVSHELRTPVTTIKGGALTLQHRWESLAPELREELLDSMTRNCDRLSEMIGRLLTVSGIQRGGIGLRPTIFSLVKTARRAAAALEEKAGERLASLHLEDIYVSGDEERLADVATSLLENALDFTGGAVQVSVHGHPAEGRLSIADEGPGMTKETLDRLLNSPFSQGDSSSTRKVEGLGLSLYIARQVLEASGGRLDIQTAPDAGSRFTMVLPAAPSNSA